MQQFPKALVWQTRGQLMESRNNREPLRHRLGRSWSWRVVFKICTEKNLRKLIRLPWLLLSQNLGCVHPKAVPWPRVPWRISGDLPAAGSGLAALGSKNSRRCGWFTHGSSLLSWKLSRSTGDFGTFWDQCWWSKGWDLHRPGIFGGEPTCT